MQTIISHINEDLHSIMAEDEKIILLGEDICDPYGGAFKATKGLSTRFGGRVIATPISESLICGLIIGLAIERMHPIGEIMFGDFLSLCFSQLLDNAAKYKKMFNNQLHYPFVLRTPMGGGRGYGATHSQSIEKYFTSIDGIQVIAINEIWDGLYKKCFSFKEDPIILIENKLLYGKRGINTNDLNKRGFNIYSNQLYFPTHFLSFENNTIDKMTFIAYGLNVSYLIEILEELYMETEISIGLIILTNLSLYDVNYIAQNVSSEGPVIVVEDGELRQGIGSELFVKLSTEIDNEIFRLGAKDMVIPSARQLESQVIVTKERLELFIKNYLSG